MSRKVYGFCDAGCKYPVPTKEEFNELNNKLSGNINIVDTVARNAARDINELEEIILDINDELTNNFCELVEKNFPSTHCVYSSYDPGNIGLKLPSSFVGFKGDTQPSGWAGKLDIEYTLPRMQAGTHVESGTYNIEVPFSALWFNKSTDGSPFDGTQVFTSYTEFLTDSKCKYSLGRTSDGSDFELEAYLMVKFKLNLDELGNFWMTDLKIFIMDSAGIKELESSTGTYHYIGLTAEISNINFFK